MSVHFQQKLQHQRLRYARYNLKFEVVEQNLHIVYIAESGKVSCS